MSNEQYYDLINQAITEMIDDNDPAENVERATIIAHIIDQVCRGDTTLYRQLQEYIEPALDLAGMIRSAR